jgi:acyl-CoA synthetase (AMP-forming)/AMP-acid ligase II
MSPQLPATCVDCSSLVELLRSRADENLDVGFTFERDRHEPVTVTYTELDLEAKRIAAALNRYDAQRQTVLLLYAPGLDFIAAFFGCLYAGAIAVTAFPPRFNGNLERLQSIVSNCHPRLGLSNSATLQTLAPQFALDECLSRLSWLDTTSRVEAPESSSWQEPHIDPEDLALIQYTSGSTAAPKGVMLTQANLLHNSRLITTTFGCHSGGMGVSWLPPYHDMGLIGSILQPMHVGAPMVLMSPLSFLQHPVRWLRTISRYPDVATMVSGGPNFAYDFCVRKIKDEDVATLDLKHWDVAYVGAEPIRSETLVAFAEKFGPAGFRYEAFKPCYGLAEATLMVSGVHHTSAPVSKAVLAESLQNHRVLPATAAGPNRNLISCGHNLPDQKIVIVNPESLTQCADGEVGEIWVSGPSVAQGYWEHEAETRATFSAFVTDTGAGPFLRTGDLGFMCEGELFVTGRIKDLIIVEGRNHYPQDIEYTVERSHAAIKPGCCAAFSVDLDNREQVVVLAEVGHRLLSDELEVVARAVRQAVAEAHDIRLKDVALLKSGNLPKTSSGKIQRHHCRNQFLNDNGYKVFC